jgi:hypothetical protein
MQRPCEVCSGLSKIGTVGGSEPPRKTRRVLVGDRIVTLCDEHAGEVRKNAIESIDGLRTLFPEPGGRRSLVGRRAPLDRRIFPARPEGRRHGGGRRHDDHIE